MSEAPQPAPAPTCPVALSALPTNFQKHVDPKAPVPLRMMGAKALVPMGPKEMATALFMLTFDTDTAGGDTAVKSAAGPPHRLPSGALRDGTLRPALLGFYPTSFACPVGYPEKLVLNRSTSDG